MPQTKENTQRMVNRDTNKDSERTLNLQHLTTKQDPNREKTDTKITEKENTELHRDERNQNMQVIKDKTRDENSNESTDERRERPGVLGDEEGT